MGGRSPAGTSLPTTQPRCAERPWLAPQGCVVQPGGPRPAALLPWVGPGWLAWLAALPSSLGRLSRAVGRQVVGRSRVLYCTVCGTTGGTELFFSQGLPGDLPMWQHLADVCARGGDWWLEAWWLQPALAVWCRAASSMSAVLTWRLAPACPPTPCWWRCSPVRGGLRGGLGCQTAAACSLLGPPSGTAGRSGGASAAAGLAEAGQLCRGRFRV